MTDVTQILSEIEHGDPAAAERLLPLIYEELRKLASAKLANEKPGQTLQATALVHEAYLGLVDTGAHNVWRSHLGQSAPGSGSGTAAASPSHSAVRERLSLVMWLNMLVL